MTTPIPCTEYLLLVFDEIETTLYDEPSALKSETLIELYTVFYRLLTLGVQPKDASATNIGLKDGHVRLIDYGLYEFIPKGPVTHAQVVKTLKDNLLYADLITPDMFDDATYITWLALTTELKEDTPELVLADATRSIDTLHRAYLWATPIDLSLKYTLTSEESRLLEALKGSKRVKAFLRDYLRTGLVDVKASLADSTLLQRAELTLAHLPLIQQVKYRR